MKYNEIINMGEKIEKYQNELVKTERLTTIGEMSARIHMILKSINYNKKCSSNYENERS